MSKLFSADEFFERRKAWSPKQNSRVIRNRKKNPLHPSTIQDLLEEKASNVIPITQETFHSWLLILWSKTGKQYSHLQGPYDLVKKQRNDIMESGEYDQSWLIAKTARDR